MTEKIEIVKYYSNLSKTYDKVRLGSIKNKIISNLQIDWVIKNLPANSTCLEIGCGTGRVTRNIVRIVSYLVACDGSLNMIKINKNISTHNNYREKTDYVLCDASHLPFSSGYFQGVIGARVFWHVPDYMKALAEAFRVVQSKKPMLFDFPSLYGPFSIFSKLSRTEHEILTLFIRKGILQKVFEKSQSVIIWGNTSFLLYFLPDRMLSYSIIRKIIDQLEHNIFASSFYSYCLVKITK